MIPTPTREQIGTARWFARKAATIEDVGVVARISFPGTEALLAVIAVRSAGGVQDLYAFPGEVRDGELRESADPGLWRALFDVAAGGGTVEGERCRLLGSGGPAPPTSDVSGALTVAPLGADQSHTTYVLGGSYALKCYRRLVAGVHPEIELTKALTTAGCTHTPAVHGSAVLEVAGEQFGLLHLQAYLGGAEDGFAMAERDLGAQLDSGVAAAAGSATGWALACGRILGELHGVLAAELGSRRASAGAVERWRRSALAQVKEAQGELGEPALSELVDALPRLTAAFAGFDGRLPPLVSRIHGDLHIGQVLFQADGTLAFIDFEGEPGRATDERRAPASPMRDLATLLRSFDHAGYWVQSLRSHPQPRDDAVVEAWVAAARYGCIAGYRSASGHFEPRLLAALEAEKAVNELLYAQRFIPSWTDVAVRGLRRLCRAR
jgi:maltokinase